MSALPTIEGYTRLTPIGRGGLGDVYRAVQTSTGADVAIKVLRDVSDSSVAWHRTRRELNALLQLSGHANVVQIVELLALPTGPALVMEYAPGGSVADLMNDRGGTLSVDETVFVGRQTAAALVSAHARGIVHRDIKPQNLLIDADGQIQLCDFGIAALTRDEEYRSRTNAISMRYASPEDLERHDRSDDEGDDADEDRDARLDGASDVYSLGATMLHIARGAPPTLRERLAPWTPPVTGDAPLAALDRVIARCLQPVPAVRPTAQALLDALEGLALGAGTGRVTALPVVDRAAAAPVVPAAAMPADPVVPSAPTVLPPTPELDPDADTIVPRRPGMPDEGGRLPDPPRPIATGPRWHRPLLFLVVAALLAVVAIVLWPSRDVDAPGPDTATSPPPTAPSLLPTTAPATPPPTAPQTTAPPTTLPPTTPPPTTPPPTTPPPTTPPPTTVPAGPVTQARPDGLVPLTDAGVVWNVGAIGDCLVQVPDQAELAVVACDQPHDLQRYAAGSVTDLGVATDAAFDEQVVADVVNTACFEAFAAFVGIVAGDSQLQTAQTRPNAATWAAGDRAYHCYLGIDGVRVFGDARNTRW